MNRRRSLTFFCLFLILSISLAQEEEDANLVPTDTETLTSPRIYYCDSDTSKITKFCPDIYLPVCARTNIVCVRAPCYPSQKEFPNGCQACHDPDVISYTIGECPELPDPQEQSCEDNYPNPPYPCPKNYDPVCVTFNVDCIQAPCPPIQQEYSNACMACNDETVTTYKPGKCEGKVVIPVEDSENEEGEICEEGENGDIVKYCKVNPGIKVLCIQAIIPVCGYFNDCATDTPCRKTFDNSCLACYYGGADYYYDGECPQDS